MASSADGVRKEGSPGTWKVAVLAMGFFTGMVVHELALEAASTEFKDLGASLAGAVTLAQFAGCAAIGK